MAKNKFYFSHDGGARNDDKIIAVRMKHKAEGYAVYFMILEKMLESSNYILARDYNILAFDFRVGSDLVKSIVEDFGLFEFTEDNKSFYSKSFKSRMEPLENLRKQRRDAGLKSAEKRAKSTKNQQNSTVVERSLTENPTKESKVNNNTNVLLEKKTTKKNGVGVFENSNFEETPNTTSLKKSEEEKEKSSAKKEKELPEGFAAELRNSQFFKNVCEFFSQKSEALQLKVAGRIISIARENKFQEFMKQTIAYMDYKNQTGERVHRFQNFSFEWDQDDWIDKFKKLNQTQNGSKESNNLNDPKIGRENLSAYEKLYKQMAGE